METEGTGKSIPPEERFNPGEEFTRKGGQILEFDGNGRPARWICPLDEEGNKIDPAGIEKEKIIHYSIGEGKYGGCIRTPEIEEEAKQWGGV